eukprot:Polyplicarium_translucidae@DN3209_c0_g1_i2.p1
MSIPMGMSYSLLANMPPQYGLYNSLIFPSVYLLLGTAQQVSVGVSAIEALLCREAIAKVASPDATEVEWVRLTVALSSCLAIVLLVLRCLRAGMIANFLADPVLFGFSTASAFLIGASQLKHAFGFDVPTKPLPQTLIYLARHLKETNIAAVVVAATTFCVLAIFKLINRWKRLARCPLPGQLVAVVVFTGICALCRLDKPPYNLRVVGEIPSGFPPFALPSFSGRREFGMLLLEALPLAIMYYVIHVSIAKTAANRRDESIDANQELLALSATNAFGCLFRCFPNATSLSRTSVVMSIGGRTVLHNIPYIGVVVMTLWFITPLLYFLPLANLAAIVLFGVLGMMNFSEAKKLGRTLTPDLLLWMVAFFVTLIFGAMEGIIASVVLSLLWLLKKAARPSTAELGQLPGTSIYRNMKRFPMAVVSDGIAIFRFDASLNFSNAAYFESKVKGVVSVKLEKSTDAHSTEEPEVKHVPAVSMILIVDGSSINDLDVTSIRMLRRLIKDCEQRKVLILFANWKGPMRDFLQHMRFYEVVPPEHCFLSLHDAVLRARCILSQTRLGISGELREEDIETTSTATDPSSRRHPNATLGRRRAAPSGSPILPMHHMPTAFPGQVSPTADSTPSGQPSSVVLPGFLMRNEFSDELHQMGMSGGAHAATGGETTSRREQSGSQTGDSRSGFGGGRSRRRQRTFPSGALHDLRPPAADVRILLGTPRRARARRSLSGLVGRDLSASESGADSESVGPGSPGIFLPGPGRRRIFTRTLTTPVAGRRPIPSRAVVAGGGGEGPFGLHCPNPRTATASTPAVFAARQVSPTLSQTRPMYEWDGLSAHTPRVQMVKEVTSRGERTWGVVGVEATQILPRYDA